MRGKSPLRLLCLLFLLLPSQRPVLLASYDSSCANTGSSAYQPLSGETSSALERAASNGLGDQYPNLPTIKAGYPTASLVLGSTPKIILKAIGYVESSWHQATYSVAPGATGAPLVSASCGYGIMQITSGMRAPGQLDPAVQRKIASDYVYNIGWGAKMLVDKWNYAAGDTAVLGQRNPRVIEDWYYAVWAYNHWDFANNPNNPAFPWPRPPFDGSQPRGNYPYQELVWGYAANPPAQGGTRLWGGVGLTLPDREKIGINPGWIPDPTPIHTDPGPSLQVSPPALYFLAEPGSNPAPLSMDLSTQEGQSLAWRAAPSTSWLLPSPLSGSALPVSLSLSANTGGLAPGYYTATLTVEASGASNTPLLVSVGLFLGPLYKEYFPKVERGSLSGW